MRLLDRLSTSVLCLTLLTGCVTTTRISLTESGKVGDARWIVVATPMGEIELTEPNLTQDSLTGFALEEGRRGPRRAIHLHDVRGISLKRFNVALTAIVLGVSGAGLYFCAAWVNAKS